MSIEFVYWKQSYLGVHFFMSGRFLPERLLHPVRRSLPVPGGPAQEEPEKEEEAQAGAHEIRLDDKAIGGKKMTPKHFPIIFAVLSTATTTTSGDGNSTATAASALTNSACRTHSSAILTATNSHSLSQSLGSQQPPSEAANSSSVAEVGEVQQQQQTNQVQRKCFLWENCHEFIYT